MPLLLLKDLPRYECLLESAKDFPDLDPSAAEAYLHLLRAGMTRSPSRSAISTITGFRRGVFVS